MSFSLNKKQQEAARHEKGPLLILSGPGSGKTTTITHKISNLIKSGLNPSRIVAVSFTRKAANELKNRVSGIVGHSATKLRCGTLHSICLSVLRELCPGSNFRVIDDYESINILTDIALDHGIAIPGKDILIDISKLKAWMITPEEAIERSQSEFEKTLGKIYYDYEYYLTSKKLLDFDNIIIELIKICEVPKYQDKASKMFDYLLVDEYQDINYAQGRAIDLFLKKHKNIAVVGDDAQAIYSFRGANLKEILNFEKRYFGTHKIVMDLNYRSTSNIVEASTRLINNNVIGFKKHLKAVSEEEGEPIYIARRYSTEDEADYITKLTMCMEGTIGILVRVYWLIPSIEEALKRKHIKYKILRDISRNLDEENDNEETKVFISTIHAAKGLEFDNVIIAGAEDGIIPHYLSLDGYGDIEEERRLFYVALTRAKKQIVITYCCNRKRWGIPSRFIEEIPDKYKEEL